MSVVLLGSTSGSVTLQEPAIAGSTVIDLPATSGTMAVLPTATSVLPEASGGTGTTTGYYGFKNRIINGGMVIDQRNAGVAVTVNTAGAFYATDRFRLSGAASSGLFTGQQVSDAPEGFVNSLKITVTTTAASSDYYIVQPIEGYNIADLDFGKATAKTVTLSFWVKSSLTGTFSGALVNSAVDRSYPFTYTISSANTWEKKSVTIAGDTSGTWLTTNGTGIRTYFSLGAYSLRGASGSWANAFYIGATGETPLIGTNGATFYITGVQLEKGSTATSFDYRPYGTELALCQRYFETSYESGNAVGSTSNPNRSVVWFAQSAQNYNNQRVNFSVSKRGSPSIAIYNPSTGTANEIRNLDNNINIAAGSSGASVTGFFAYTANVSVGVSVSLGYHYTASSEL